MNSRPDPSAQQRLASDPSLSAWVAASAGSGKTKVLTDRVLRLLLAGAMPSRIVCITYTNAAAAEMHNRIHDRLGRWVGMEEAALSQALEALTGAPPAAEMLRRARRLFASLLEESPGLRIQTFHSFCQSLLARFPLEAGVPPHFTLIEEQQARHMMREARMRLLQNALSRSDPGLSAAVEEMIAEIGESGFIQMLEEIIGRRRTLERFLEASAPANPCIHYATCLYEQLGLPYYGAGETEIMAAHLPLDAAAQAEIRAIRDVLLEGSTQDKAVAKRLGLYLESLRPHDLLDALLTESGKASSRLMTSKIQQAYPQHQARLEAFAQACEVVQERLNALAVARFSSAVLVVAESLFALYAAMKRAHGGLDYDDLILKTCQLLRGEGMAAWVLYKIDGGIDHVLIDEAQDTSAEQWELKEVLEDEFFAGLGARPAGRTLFVVGDSKQSIYGFQGADPQGFSRQLVRTHARTAQAHERFEPVPMHTSFRSAPAVLKAVDAVFAEESAGSGLGEAVEHWPMRVHAPGRVELWPLSEPHQNHPAGESAAGAPWPIPSARRESATAPMALAREMAVRIAGWVQSGTWRPGEVLVLVRRRGDFVHFLSRCLKEHGVPVAGLDRMKLTEHLAVQDLLALAQFLLLPEDDYTLACLLKSPLYGVTEERLFTLCHARGDASLWARLCADAHGADMAHELRGLLARADFGGPYRLYAHVLYAQKGRQRFAARMGAEVEEVLDEFLALVMAYERTGAPTLQGWLTWIGQGAGEIKRDMEQQADEVRIMTVHGAKGLEAPVVLLADTTSRASLKDRVFMTEDGSGKPWVLASPRSEADCAQVLALRQARRQAMEDEDKRLLYVAMTRARDVLHVTGWRTRHSGHAECWYRRVQRGLERLPGTEALPDGTLVYAEAAQAADTPAALPPHGLAVPPLPPYAHTAPPSEAALAPLLAPSHLDEDADVSPAAPPVRYGAALQRGLLVHRLLHLLSVVEDAQRETGLMRYLAVHAPELEEEGRQAICSEVLGVMRHPDFAGAFLPEALAEAPIIGEVEGRRLAGQIDRLMVSDTQVLAIDFKTGAPPAPGAEPPVAYRRQMEAYRALLACLYPGRRVRCALVYTAGPMLVEIA